MTARLTVLTRSWCHLCDDLIDLLMWIAVSADVEIRVADIDEDEALLSRWDELVPVLLDGAGEELCHYHLDIVRVCAYLARFPIKSHD